MGKWMLPLLFLIGCGQHTDDTILAESYFCPQFGCHYEIEDAETGIRVRYDDPEYREISLEAIKGVYQYVQNCAGLYPERGPLIVFVDAATADKINADYRPGQDKAYGFYFRESGGVAAIRSLSPYLVSHEMLHHVLITAGNLEGHPEPYFPNCITYF